MTEVWQPIPGYSKYEASSMGRLRKASESHYVLTDICPSNKGYLTICIKGDVGRRKRLNVHVLIAAAFLGPRPKGRECSHLNDVKTDNRSMNIIYSTHKENCALRSSNGRWGGQLKLSVEKVREIKARIKTGEKLKTIAADYGVSQQTISSIKIGHTWTWIDTPQAYPAKLKVKP